MAARISATLLRTQNDQRLVALAAQGSEQAFEALVERYRRPLQAYCRRLLLPAETGEDVVQQAFLSTWQALQRGTEVHDLRAWLYRVTHNAALNALKKSGYDHAELDEALHGAGAPDEDLERRIAIRRTLAGLAALPELQREALLRTAVEGQSHEAVARALGLSDGAVRGLVYRARATLRTAATALTPAPVAQWAASAGGADGPLTERVAELVAGGGTAGAGALLAKGGTALLATGALAGGAAVVEKKALDDPAPKHAEAQARETRAPAKLQAAAPGSARDSEGVLLGDATDRPDGEGRSAAALVRQRADRDRDDDDDDDSGSGTAGSDSGPGSGDDDDDDNSGSGSVSSGSGSGDGDDDSGSGSDSSGSGSGDDGDDDSGSGSDSSGSGSGDDSSGSGSGDGDSSGSGSSGSGSGDAVDDSSGSGSSGSGSSGSGSGSDSSGSGAGEIGLDAADSSGSGSSGSRSGSGSDSDDVDLDDDSSGPGG